MVSDNHAGDPPLSRVAAASSAVGADGRPGRHGRRSALRAAVDARLEELPFSRGVVLMVTAGLALTVLVIGTAVALTAGGSGSKDPRSAAPLPSAPPSASPGATGPSPKVRHRHPGTSSSTMVGPVPSHSASPQADPSATPSWWPPGNGRPHWRYTSPPPWWGHR